MSLSEIKDPAAESNPINKFYANTLNVKELKVDSKFTTPIVALTSSTVTAIPGTTFTNLDIGPTVNLYDPYSFKTSNTQLTIPTGMGGQYWCQLGCRFADSKVGTSRGIALGIAGVPQNPMGWVTIDTVGVGRISADLSFLITLNAGQVISIMAWQDSGANLNVTACQINLTKLS